MMARFLWYLDPLSSHKKEKEKNVVKVGPPLAKLSGSGHEGCVSVVVDSLFVVAPIVCCCPHCLLWFCVWSLFCYTFSALSSVAITILGNRELVHLL